MREDERVWAVKQLLFQHVSSPSLKHIRDPYAVTRLAVAIVERVDQGNSVWQKWDGQRELLLRSATPCWIPLEDLQSFLNQMPGPPLSLTDVAQRFKAFEEEDLSFAKDELKEGCLEIYAREQSEGTELPAIIGCLRDHVEREQDRLREEQRERYLQWKETDRLARETRLMSGADCKWTQFKKSAAYYCRSNGRLFRANPTKDKRWDLHRVEHLGDERGLFVGCYEGRPDATKAISKVAYEADLIR